jgi:serine/threonine protein kinase
VANYTRQILSGLQFLHANGIIHRDIKGGNVLVDESGSVKLADFGASTRVNPAFDKTQETITFKGTPYFMAPEVLGHGKYGRKGDIWAVGCTIIQMLTGQPPWKDRNITGLVQLHILLSDMEGPPTYPSDKVTAECREFIVRCFAKDEKKRPAATELLTFPFLADQDNLEDSGSVVQSFEQKRVRAFSSDGSWDGQSKRPGSGGDDDDDDDGGENDPFEDSGVSQMADLRAQIARLAQSTENIHGDTFGPGPGPVSVRGGASSSSSSESNDGTMGAVQRQIEKRKLVKKAVDVSRRKERGEATSPPPSNEVLPGSGSSSSSSLQARVNPFARGAGTQKIGSGNNRTPRGTTAADSVAVPASRASTASSAGARAAAGTSDRSAATRITRIRTTRSQEAGTFVVATNGGGGGGGGGGNISSARDSESLTPGEEPESPQISSLASPLPVRNGNGNGGSNSSSSSSRTPPVATPTGADKYGKEVWVCLACTHRNMEPDYCIKCSVVRGSTGKKGVGTSVVKR